MKPIQGIRSCTFNLSFNSWHTDVPSRYFRSKIDMDVNFTTNPLNRSNNCNFRNVSKIAEQYDKS